MATILDSTAAFNARATEHGLTDAQLQRLQRQGITSLSQLAFALTTPGTSPGDDALKGLISDEPDRVNAGQLASIRRLTFDAQTLSAAQVKHILAGNEAAKKAELVPAERAQRIQNQRDKLAGMELSGPYECSHASYDPTTTSLACDLMGVCTFKCMERWHRFLMDSMQLHPPPGYKAPTTEQILRADRAGWIRIAQKVESLKRKADGTLPLDTALDELRTDPSTVFHLMPLPSIKGPDKPTKPAVPIKRDSPPKQAPSKGKGKGKGKTKHNKGRMPCWIESDEEVFSGIGGLTAAMRRIGLRNSVGVDAHVTKRVKAPIIRLDLTTTHGIELLWRILSSPSVVAVHLGPPCGTSSRARDIRRPHGTPRLSTNKELAAEVYKITVEECERGWLKGPFTLDELPSRSVLTRRFGVQQSSTMADGSRVYKTRPIDDFSESLVNSTNSCEESIQPMSIDMILAALAMRHRCWGPEELLGKSIDLRKAYKNLPVCRLKRKQILPIARILGVQIDLNESLVGAFSVCNVETRVKDLVSTIDGILSKKTMSAAEMRVLRGRLVFAEAQIYGRLAGIHMQELSRWEHAVGESQIDDDLRDSLRFLRDRIVLGGPRRVLADHGRVFHLYTDAFYEGGVGGLGLGGILYDGHGNMLSFFSTEVNEQILNPSKKETIIFELEALAVLVGCTHLLPSEGILQNDRIVVFIDNEAVLSRLVSGKGGNLVDNKIFQGVLTWEHDTQAVSWYERVPSSANPSDAPSRGDKSGLCSSLEIEVDVGDVLKNFQLSL
eukprot:s4056_g9.t1